MTKNAVAVFVRITSVHLEIQKRRRTETILDYENDTIRLERLRAISCAVGIPLAYSDLFDATNREV